MKERLEVGVYFRAPKFKRMARGVERYRVRFENAIADLDERRDAHALASLLERGREFSRAVQALRLDKDSEHMQPMEDVVEELELYAIESAAMADMARREALRSVGLAKQAISWMGLTVAKDWEKAVEPDIPGEAEIFRGLFKKGFYGWVSKVSLRLFYAAVLQARRRQRR